MQPPMRDRDSAGHFERHRGLCPVPWTSGDEGEGVPSLLFGCPGRCLAVLSSCWGCDAMMRRDAIHEEFVKLPPRCDWTDWLAGPRCPPAPVESRSKSPSMTEQTAEWSGSGSSWLFACPPIVRHADQPASRSTSRSQLVPAAKGNEPRAGVQCGVVQHIAVRCSTR